MAHRAMTQVDRRTVFPFLYLHLCKVMSATVDGTTARDMRALLGENGLRQVNIGSFVTILCFYCCGTM
jgi:hypothetical protein